MAPSFPVQLLSQDGQVFSFECSETQTLLDAARAAGLSVPAVCEQGNCGTCRAHCQSGRYALGAHADSALSQEDGEHGELLLCRSRPLSPLTISVETPAARLTAGAPHERTGEVTIVSDLGGGVRRLVLRLLPDSDGAMDASFEPGQFMELSPPGRQLRRAYSLANTPNWDGALEFLIRLQPGGAFSTWLASEARAGDRLALRGPLGSFALKEGSLAPRRFLAGGTGLAPLLSMLRSMAELGEPQDSHLYFGVNRRQELFGEPELTALAASLPGLQITICLWRHEPGDPHFAGSPIDALRPSLIEDCARGKEPELYVCGPPGLVAAAERLVAEVGLPRSHLHSERFLQS